MKLSKKYLAKESKEPAKSKMTPAMKKHEAKESKAKEKAEHKKPFSTSKAKTILKEKNPTLHGKPITKSQRGLLGLIAGGGTPSRKKGFKG